MQGISERIKGSGIWWIRWTSADGKRHFEKAGTHSAAKTLLAKRRQETILGKKQPELLRGRALTFNDLCDDAIKHSTAENSEKQTYELRLRIEQIRPAFGSRAADSIRKNEVVEWLTEQAEEREWAATTQNRWQATFSLIFRVGMDNEKIERNPAARIRKKTEGGGRVRFLSDPEEKRLRAAIERRFAEFLSHFLLSIHTGMRMSEQYGLRWNQVDFARKQLHLIRTKNGDSRTIPLNSIALGALQELRGKETRPGTDPVFPSVRTGDALQGSRGWFSTALEEAKIADYTWHCNRHTFASRLVMAGVDLRTVAELLGHRTLQMVMRYSHLAPEHQASAVDRLVPAGRRMVTKSATDKPAMKSPKQTQTLTH
jgi:integrase